MREMMAGFIIGIIFTIPVSYLLHRMIMREKVPDMVKEETEKRIKDLEFDNSFLVKKLNLKTIQYNRLTNNVNDVLLCDRKNIKDIIKKLDGR